jgi:hypothetical protein
MKIKEKMKYYNINKILEKKAQYNIVFGERSNGKTYAVLKHGLENYLKDGKQLAIVRRWKEDMRGKRGASFFDALVANDEIRKLTNGEWSNVYYYSGRWYLAKYDEELKKQVTDENPIAYGFALSDMEHDKSSSYPNITTIMFDEFLTRQYYLNDEFVTFMNVISTIVRYRKDVTIFMLGNTVNKYCPYFKEFGLTHVDKMEKGKIDLYTYGDTELKVAVEYADSPNKEKPSDLYFAFDNPKLNMITTGTWEIAIYPHLQYKFKSSDILLTYFIKFTGETLQCEVIHVENKLFTYIHRKTTPIKDEDKDIIYSLEYDSRPNHFRRLTRPSSQLERKIADFFKREKVVYQDNEVGEIVRNYLMASEKDKIL